MSEDLMETVRQGIIEGEAEDVEEATQKALAGSVPGGRILAAMGEAMKVVGDKYNCHTYFLPDMILAAEAMKAGLALIESKLQEERMRKESLGVIIIGTVAGDVHDIGKSIVQSMLVGAGFQVIDLGVDVSAEKFVEKTREMKPDIVAASAYMATSSLGLQRIGEALVQAGLREKVKYLIGGAATHPGMVAWAKADAYAGDANEASEVARQLLGR